MSRANTRLYEFGPFRMDRSASRPSALASPATRLVCSAQLRDTIVNPVQLTAFNSTFDEHTPAYSPEGKRLGFPSPRSGAEEIRIANRYGSNPLQVMGGPAVLESSVVDGRMDDSVQLATRGLGRPLCTSTGYRQTHSADRPSGIRGGTPMVARRTMDLLRVGQDRADQSVAHARGRTVAGTWVVPR